MNNKQSEPKTEAKDATKEKFFQFACDDQFLEVLNALAKKHRASKAYVARLAVFKLAEKEAVEA